MIPKNLPRLTQPLVSNPPVSLSVNPVLSPILPLSTNTSALPPSTAAFDSTNVAFDKQEGLNSALLQIFEQIKLMLNTSRPKQAASADVEAASPLGSAQCQHAQVAQGGQDIGTSATMSQQGAASPLQGAILPNATTDPGQKQRLDTALSQIQSTEDGAKLIAEAKANGYTIRVGDPQTALGGALDAGATVDCPHCKAALDAGRQVNGVTVTYPNGKKEMIINPNAENFTKTVAHELVHAATEKDGNSLHEEGIADAIAYNIVSQITTGTELSDAEMQRRYEEKMKQYTNLGTSNAVSQTLASLGIDVPNVT